MPIDNNHHAASDLARQHIPDITLGGTIFASTFWLDVLQPSLQAIVLIGSAILIVWRFVDIGRGLWRRSCWRSNGGTRITDELDSSRDIL